MRYFCDNFLSQCDTQKCKTLIYNEIKRPQFAAAFILNTVNSSKDCSLAELLALPNYSSDGEAMSSPAARRAMRSDSVRLSSTIVMSTLVDCI